LLVAFATPNTTPFPICGRALAQGENERGSLEAHPEGLPYTHTPVCVRVHTSTRTAPTCSPACAPVCALGFPAVVILYSTCKSLAVEIHKCLANCFVTVCNCFVSVGKLCLSVFRFLTAIAVRSCSKRGGRKGTNRSTHPPQPFWHNIADMLAKKPRSRGLPTTEGPQLKQVQMLSPDCPGSPGFAIVSGSHVPVPTSGSGCANLSPSVAQQDRSSRPRFSKEFGCRQTCSFAPALPLRPQADGAGSESRHALMKEAHKYDEVFLMWPLQCGAPDDPNGRKDSRNTI